MLREVAGTGGGDPPGSAPAPLSSFLRRRPAEPVPWRGRRAATATAPPGVACGARPRPKGEQALGARGGGQMGEGEWRRRDLGDDRLWDPDLEPSARRGWIGGGGGDGGDGEAPTWGGGARARVRGQKGGGEGSGEGGGRALAQ